MAKSPTSNKLKERTVHRAYIDLNRSLVMQLSLGVVVVTESPSPLHPTPGVRSRHPSFPAQPPQHPW